jgi:hypothetical protein
MRAKLITLWTIVLLTGAGCPLTIIDTPPCGRCDPACDDGLSECSACRREECPDLAAE